MHNWSESFQNLNPFGWVVYEKAPTTRTNMVASMPPCLLISASAFPSSLLPLLAKPFLQSRNYFILSQSFLFHESSNKKEFLKVTLKQQTDYYLINYLCPNQIPKHFFLLFPFLIFLKPGLSFITSDLETSLRFFSNEKRYLLMVIFQTENIIKLYTSHWCLNFQVT